LEGRRQVVANEVVLLGNEVRLRFSLRGGIHALWVGDVSWLCELCAFVGYYS